MEQTVAASGGNSEGGALTTRDGQTLSAARAVDANDVGLDFSFCIPKQACLKVVNLLINFHKKHPKQLALADQKLKTDVHNIMKQYGAQWSDVKRTVNKFTSYQQYENTDKLAKDKAQMAVYWKQLHAPVPEITVDDIIKKENLPQSGVRNLFGVKVGYFEKVQEHNLSRVEQETADLEDLEAKLKAMLVEEVAASDKAEPAGEPEPEAEPETPNTSTTPLTVSDLKAIEKQREKLAKDRHAIQRAMSKGKARKERETQIFERVQKAGDSSESKLLTFLLQQGITRDMMETEQEQKQRPLHLRNKRTPDILFRSPVTIQGKRVHWIDSKNVFILPGACPSYEIRKLKRQMNAYVKMFGPGMIVWKGLHFSTLAGELPENILHACLPLGWKSRPVPPDYTCKACGKKGHFIKHCLVVGKEAKERKKKKMKKKKKVQVSEGGWTSA